MKEKYILIGLMMCTIAISFGMNFMSCNKFSIGIIDLNVILQDTSLGKAELEKIQTMVQEKRVLLTQKENQLKAEQESLQKQAAFMSEKIRQTKMEEFQKKVVEFQEEVRMSEFSLKQEEDTLKKKMIDNLKDPIKKIQKSKNIQIVYEKSNIPLYGNFIDITSDLINVLK